MKQALQLIDITKTFGQKQKVVAVGGVSFEVARGEIVGLLGPNGAGKSTIIQMLVAALKPSSGLIRYFGLNLHEHRSQIMEQVGYVSGYARLPGNLTVRGNLEIQGRLHGYSRTKSDSLANILLERFGVIDLTNKLAGGLSAGQATRVMLAKAFMVRPQVALLDEPTAALDPDVCQIVREFVQEQRARHEVSMIYTSHNMSEVAEICDRVIFLRKGKILAEDTPERLARAVATSQLCLKANEYTADLIRFLEERGFDPKTEDAAIEISIEEEEVSDLLAAITTAGLRFSNFELRKPTLEDFFLRASTEEISYEST